MPVAYYSFDKANKHKRLWQGVWAKVIWVDDAGANVLAVIHWMGGGYKVVGRYLRDEDKRAIAHAEKCSASGYCQTTPDDNAGFIQALANEMTSAL